MDPPPELCDVKAAFAACKAKRKVVSLNKKMRRALTEWQERYVTVRRRKVRDLFRPFL